MDLLVYHLDSVNWWAVLLASLASFAVGSAWYSPALFGKPWMKALGIKQKDIKTADMTVPMVVSGVLAFVTATGLAALMHALGFDTWIRGAVFGLLVGLAFVATNRGIHMLFEQKAGLNLYLINAGHDLVFLALAGAIIGAL